ncbi:CRISPR-associated helicase/endonuclease Cas3 [Lysinibacillus macroides]|uniref:Metal-dependent phosphohydrolase n=1 Tax=Lysinibacillus macroides TaxID=33935 RepID=A0A0M9DMY1_9BACI|nr:CRISPR-associated helicase/endonuclease Cas3 [Lysinibacillus macroides]KOY83412.1 metal-dependent phosphohydrolase [Lysinibacillus macroides]QPR69281.1 CRISPR-associated helicase/endonuclease Cas3 [Lysinibacillus macroides]
MFKKLLAKSAKKDKPAQTIAEHTNELIKQWDLFGKIYPSALSDKDWKILLLAVKYHDVGKANTKFQNKVHDIEERIKDLFPEFAEIPHGYVSCAFIPIDDLLEQYSEEEVTILILAVYYHHEREEQNFDDSNEDIEKELGQYVPMLVEDFGTFDTTKDLAIREEPIFDYEEFTERKYLRNRNHLNHFVRIKGLLNKLDYAASGNYEVEVPPEKLPQKMEKYFREKGHDKNELQEHLYHRQQANHVVIASTGIGKTEAALWWLGNDKGIFTLPLKVSINAIYDRLIAEIGCNRKTTGLLHSDMHAEYVKRADDQDLDLVTVTHAKNLSMPLTVTTIDQIIDFVGLYPGFEMKLATLSYSKIIIDEIQMYSPRLAAFIVLGLKYITDMGGKFLIMTATLPPLFVEALKRLDVPFEKPGKPFLKRNSDNQPIKRHVMQIVEKDLTKEEILKHALNRKVLIIVNTVTKAQQLYQAFQATEIAVSLLHGRFISQHRKEKEDAILKLGKRICTCTGIWITTQLVEASVNIDFDVLFTELSDASGLFQRMGRVYRERDYLENIPNIYVFTGEPLPSGIANTRRSIVDYTIYEKSKEVLLQYNNQLIDEQTKMDIVEQVYSREALGEVCDYMKTFDETLAWYKDLLPYQEEEKPTLRDIQNQLVIPYVIYNQNRTKIDDINEQISEKLPLDQRIKLLIELQKFTVPIATWAYDNARKRKNGEISSTIRVDRFTEYPIITYQYTEDQGLIFENDYDALFQ